MSNADGIAPGQVASSIAETDPLLQAPAGWRIIYFDAPNRGECLRLILTAAGQEFEDIRLDFMGGELNKYKSTAVGDDTFMFFDQARIPLI